MKVQKILVSLLTTAIVTFGSIALAADAKMDDASITTTLKKQFQKDKILARETIVIETKDGIVILSGDVRSQNGANKAIEKAQSVPGVTDVNADKLTVKGENNTEHRLKDAYITAKVKGAFLRDKLFGDKPISVRKIHVKTKEGVVYLTGTVADEAMANNAKEIAGAVKGVSSVESSLKIQAKK